MSLLRQARLLSVRRRPAEAATGGPNLQEGGRRRLGAFHKRWPRYIGEVPARHIVTSPRHPLQATWPRPRMHSASRCPDLRKNFFSYCNTTDYIIKSDRGSGHRPYACMTACPYLLLQV